jgi:hypothetical protein
MARYPDSGIDGIATLCVAIALFAGTLHAQTTTSEVREIAEHAYIYAYPLVLIEATRANMPVNRLTHVPQFPRPDSRQVIRPNADTLYSTAWLDVSREPVLIYVPDSGGRFYLMQFMDAWTETFADPGKRTTGTAEAWLAVVGPHWTGKLPEHVTRLDSATNIVWLLGRTQTNGTSDYDNVRSFQHGMRIMPLSAYPNGAQTLGSPLAFGSAAGGTPPEQVKAMEPRAFFAAFATALKANPPHESDAAMVRDLARIGIVPGQDFDVSKLTADQLRALDEGAQAAAEHLEKFVGSGAAIKPGWSSFQGTVGRYGTNYMARAITARVAVGANPAEDAVYIGSSADGSGQPYEGSMHYRMHFDASSLPPVNAFWSVTAYDKDGYFVINPMNRYAIGDRDRLKFSADGSLDLYIQGQDPGPDRQSNWLPTGEGAFNLMFRLYWPKEAVLNGTWHPPALERLP